MLTVHVSLNKANLNTIDISTPDFCIWQHFSSNWTAIHLEKLVDIPEIPVAQLYKHMIDHDGPTLLFQINRNTKEETSFIWKLLAYPGTYTGTIGMVFISYIGVYWCRPATQRCQPYSPVSLQLAIVDDDVEVAPIFRS